MKKSQKIRPFSCELTVLTDRIASPPRATSQPRTVHRAVGHDILLRAQHAYRPDLRWCCSKCEKGYVSVITSNACCSLCRTTHRTFGTRYGTPHVVFQKFVVLSDMSCFKSSLCRPAHRVSKVRCVVRHIVFQKSCAVTFSNRLGIILLSQWRTLAHCGESLAAVPTPATDWRKNECCLLLLRVVLYLAAVRESPLPTSRLYRREG